MNKQRKVVKHIETPPISHEEAHPPLPTQKKLGFKNWNSDEINEISSGHAVYGRNWKLILTNSTLLSSRRTLDSVTRKGIALFPAPNSNNSNKDNHSIGMFAVGSKIAARWEGGDDWFDGTIAQVNSDGTYDILYSDGDEEDTVAEPLIQQRTFLILPQPASPSPTPSSLSPPPPSPPPQPGVEKSKSKKKIKKSKYPSQTPIWSPPAKKKQLGLITFTNTYPLLPPTPSPPPSPTPPPTPALIPSSDPDPNSNSDHINSNSNPNPNPNPTPTPTSQFSTEILKTHIDNVWSTLIPPYPNANYITTMVELSMGLELGLFLDNASRSVVATRVGVLRSEGEVWASGASVLSHSTSVASGDWGVGGEEEGEVEVGEELFDLCG